MVEPVTLKVNGSSTWLNDADTQLITLYAPSTGAKSMHKSDNTDYLIPAGKKFIILHMVWTASSDSNTYVDYNTTPDTDAGGTQFYTNYVKSTSHVVDNVYYEISAGNYINHENGVGTLTGIETDT